LQNNRHSTESKTKAVTTHMLSTLADDASHHGLGDQDLGLEVNVFQLNHRLRLDLLQDVVLGLAETQIILCTT